MKQRVKALEAELAGRTIPPPPGGEAPLPENGDEDVEQARAVERALIRRGTAVLPAGELELTPGISWIHSGSACDHSR